MSVTYNVRLLNPSGNVIANNVPSAVMRWTVSEMVVGNLVIKIPGGTLNRNMIQPDSRIELWRRVDTLSPMMIGGQWLINKIEVSGNSEDIWINAADFNSLLENRVIDYPASTPDVSNPYTDKSGHADDIIKAFVRENIGSLATNTARRIGMVSVQPDFGLAPSVKKQASRKNLLTTLQDVARSSFEAGTYLTWGWDFSENSAIFRTAINSLGIDHGMNSSMPLIISRERGNLLEPMIVEDYSEERNYIIVGGLGEGTERAIATAESMRAAANPMARKEWFTSGYNTENNDTLSAEASAALIEHGARRIMTGMVAETENLRFGIHVNFGDIVVAEYAGYSFDCRLSTISAEVIGGIETQLEIRLRGEELI